MNREWNVYSNGETTATELLEKVSQRLGAILANLEEMAAKHAQERAERGEGA